jgi:23S rRNA (guanosine2251-2'-O)-methyltransferase
VISGRNAVREAVSALRRTVYEVFALEACAHELQDLAPGVAVRVMDRAGLEGIAGTPEHQGMAARVSPYSYASLDDLLGMACVVVLDSVEDPHNLGAVVRAAHALMGAGVVIPQKRAAPVTPAVVRASAGATEHATIARVVNLRAAASSLKDAGFWLVGLDMGSELEIGTVPDFEKVALVVGGEDRGIRPVLSGELDIAARIPMRTGFNSLNLSQAAAIALYELASRGRRR